MKEIREKEKERERERERAGDREHPTEMLFRTCAVKDPCLDRSRPSCASCCYVCRGAVDGQQLIPSTIVHCWKNLFVQLLLPLAHHLPYDL